ncbi:hypothetical protein [Actinomadura parmotrematis]|uniref:Uncharacterized protein n=1 Tax=Actinomadura parmotrematis TaxID=2864039 RepID=A0ABS7FPJ5_9ACTN|nr:hypothetical protein [Actinomadura parmotrematis]MBW8482231.1 hypothetical protein [Actinomadura parmotrematis]
MTEEGSATVDLALAELRRGFDVRLAELEGRLVLAVERGEVRERRIDDQNRLLDELADRLVTAEREQVTHGQLDDRFRHTVALLSLIATVASVAVGLLATLLPH